MMETTSSSGPTGQFTRRGAGRRVIGREEGVREEEGVR